MLNIKKCSDSIFYCTKIVYLFFIVKDILDDDEFDFEF